MNKSYFAVISAASYAVLVGEDKDSVNYNLVDLLSSKFAKFNIDDSPVVDSDAERFSRDFEVVHSADFIPGDKDGFSATDR